MYGDSHQAGCPWDSPVGKTQRALGGPTGRQPREEILQPLFTPDLCVPVFCWDSPLAEPEARYLQVSPQGTGQGGKDGEWIHRGRKDCPAPGSGSLNLENHYVVKLLPCPCQIKANLSSEQVRGRGEVEQEETKNPIMRNPGNARDPGRER